jgi:hypothetical protein
MGITSKEAKRLQFSGSEYSYDGTEVEAFRRRVIAALETYESASDGIGHLPDASGEDLASAQRVRHQAVELAARMLRDVMGSTGDSSGGLAVWQDAAMLRALAQEEMEFATEEARRLPAIAAAERDEIRVRYAEERKEMRAELHRELQASRDAAIAEAEDIRSLSQDEANEIVKNAVGRAEESQRAASEEVNRLQRRITVLHTALADAEARFRRLAATAANEIGTLAAIADQDVADSDIAEPVRPDLHLSSVDLTDEGLDRPVDTTDSDKEEVVVDPDAGFYQKRLAGLRDRLEKSGHPPQ